MIKMILKSLNLKNIIILVFLMVFLITGTAISREIEPGHDVYIFPIPEESLDPHLTWEQGRTEIINNLYDSLYKYNSKTGEYIPDLALDGITVKSDYNDNELYKNIIPINTDKLFADGSYLTPEDVRYSILRLMMIDSDSSGSAYFWKSIFGLPDLASFTEKVSGYSSLEYLSFQAARRVYNAINNRIYIENDNLIILSEDNIDFKLLLSNRVPWSAILNKDILVEQGDWDGSPENWPLFYQRKPKSSPLYDNNSATSSDWRVVKWRSNEHLTLVESDPDKSWYQEKSSIKLFFPPSRINQFAGPLINSTVSKALFPLDIEFITDYKIIANNYRKDEVSAESLIYFIKNLREDKINSNSVIYYHNNKHHKNLIEKLIDREEYKKNFEIKGLSWPDYYDRILNGDYDYAIVEWLEPFGDKIPNMYTRNREFKYPVEIKEILDKPGRLFFERVDI